MGKMDTLDCRLGVLPGIAVVLCSTLIKFLRVVEVMCAFCIIFALGWVLGYLKCLSVVS